MKMKKIFVICVFFLSVLGCAAALAENSLSAGRQDYAMLNPEGYEGYWLEKSEGRLIMSVTPVDEPDWYDVTVVLRGKLPKMDVYMMRAHYQEDGNLHYDNCQYVLRKIRKDGSVQDKIKYKNGTGFLNYRFDDNALYWTDYTLKPDKKVRVFSKTTIPDPDANDIAN